MENHRFDDITRTFASRQSRRGFLGALGGAIAALGVGRAGAQSNGNGNGNGNGNLGSFNGNGNGNANTGSFNGNGNGNGNRNSGWGNGNGYGNGNGWPQPEPTDCTDGAMTCEGAGFLTCVDGNWVYRDCAPGTACREDTAAGIVCDGPTGP